MDRRSKTSRPEPLSIRQRIKHDFAAIPLKPLPPSDPFNIPAGN
jgi:hypothetical protein